MTGYLSLTLYILAILIVFAACRLHVHRNGSRFPAFRTAGVLVFCSILFHLLPPLRHLSVFRIIYALSGEYLDLFWITFYFSTAIILASDYRHTVVHIAVITALSLFAAVGISTVPVRDLSRDGAYTLKPCTVTLLDRLDSECIITWYRTDSYAESLSGTALSMLLDRYERQNREHLRFYARDPVQNISPAFPEKLGLVPLADGNYSGILIEYRGSSRLVPVIAGHTLAEYELTRSIESLVEGSREYPLQVLVLGNPGSGHDHLQLLLEHAEFTLVPVDNPENGLDERVPLVVIGSRFATGPVARSIDEFLNRGGNALVMVSGIEIDSTGDWSARTKSGDPVIELLRRRGIAIQDRLLRDKNHYTIIMNALDDAGIRTVPYPYWIRIPESGFLNGHSVFSGVPAIQLYWPSPVTIDDSAGIPLMETGKNAQADHAPFDTRPLVNSGETVWSGEGSFIVGVIRDDGSRLIVIPDEHAVASLNDFTGAWDNYTFFVNCAEWISGREHITTLKRREPSSFALVRRLFP